MAGSRLEALMNSTIQLGSNDRVFILEDDPIRIKWFKRNLIGVDYTIVDNAPDAIAELKELDNDYTVIFLDHDLGGKQYVSTKDDNTGSEVARFLATQDLEDDLMIILHTFNQIGAVNMNNLLPTSVYIPFGMFKIKIIKEEDN